MTDSPSPLQKGAQLVSYFQSVFLNLANMEVSRQEAHASEQRAVSELQYFGGANILNPRNIPVASSAEIAKSSVDAHIKKVQAEQIEHLSKVQLEAANTEASTQYVGRKVAIRIHDKEFGMVESVWFNPNKGYSTSQVKTNSIKGRIKEVLLEKNALIVEPTLSARIIDPGRKFFIVYIIDPNTFEPLLDMEVF
jgi:hypothetical protein